MASSPAAVDRATRLNISDVQAALKADGIDGWLLYDFRGINPIAADITAVARQEGHLATRRWYYLIPAEGEPRGRALYHVRSPTHYAPNGSRVGTRRRYDPKLSPNAAARTLSSATMRIAVSGTT